MFCMPTPVVNADTLSLTGQQGHQATALAKHCLEGALLHMGFWCMSKGAARFDVLDAHWGSTFICVSHANTSQAHPPVSPECSALHQLVGDGPAESQLTCEA